MPRSRARGEQRWTTSGARVGEAIRLDRPACGPPVGARRPWQWLADLEDHKAGRTEQARPLSEREILARILES